MRGVARGAMGAAWGRGGGQIDEGRRRPRPGSAQRRGFWPGPGLLPDSFPGFCPRPRWPKGGLRGADARARAGPPGEHGGVGADAESAAVEEPEVELVGFPVAFDDGGFLPERGEGEVGPEHFGDRLEAFPGTAGEEPARVEAQLQEDGDGEHRADAEQVEQQRDQDLGGQRQVEPVRSHGGGFRGYEDGAGSIIR